jgi:hypothetical protein
MPRIPATSDIAATTFSESSLNRPEQLLASAECFMSFNLPC